MNVVKTLILALMLFAFFRDHFKDAFQMLFSENLMKRKFDFSRFDMVFLKFNSNAFAKLLSLIEKVEMARQ